MCESMEKKSRWIAILLFATFMLASTAFWLMYFTGEGVHDALTAEEIAAGWTLLFDGQTTKGWEFDGQAEIQDGLLILGGSRVTTATIKNPVDDFELHFEYRFASGSEGLMVLKREGSASDYGLGQLTSRPSQWNRVTFTRLGGASKLICEPLRTTWFSSSNTILGQTTAMGPDTIAFRVPFPGNALILRSLKFKPNRAARDEP